MMKKFLILIIMAALTFTPVIAAEIEFATIEISEEEEMLQSFMDDINFQIDEIESAWNAVNERVQQLTENNEEILKLLQDSERKIRELRRRLASAEQGVLDSLDSWWYMESLLDDMRGTVDAWEKDYVVLQKKGQIGTIVTASGITIGIGGGTALGYGIAKSDPQLIGIGAGVVAIDALVYVAGKWLFKWW